jgi:hypothetical protein
MKHWGTPQLALVEPDHDACGSQRIAETPSCLGVLQGIVRQAMVPRVNCSAS